MKQKKSIWRSPFIALLISGVATCSALAQWKPLSTATQADSYELSQLKKSVAASDKLSKTGAANNPKPVPYSAAARELGRCSLNSDSSAAEIYHDRLNTLSNGGCHAPSPPITDFRQVASQFEEMKRTLRPLTGESTHVEGAGSRLVRSEQATEQKLHLKQERELLRRLLFNFDDEIRGPTEKALVNSLKFEKKTQGGEAGVAQRLNQKMEALNQLCTQLRSNSYQEAKKNFDLNSPKGNLGQIEAMGKRDLPILRAAFQGILLDPDFQALVASEAFQKSAGLEHLAQGTAMETCQKNGVAFFVGGREELGILHVEKEKNLLSADVIGSANKEVQSSIQSQLSALNTVKKELISKDLPGLSDQDAVKKMTAALSKHIATHPVAFANILKKQPSLELAHELCFLTKKALSNDIDREHLNTLITIAGVASLPASFLLPGAGAALLSLGLTATFDIGANASTLSEDFERRNAYQVATTTNFIRFSEGYRGTAKASSSLDMTTLSLVLAAGGAVNDLSGLSQGLAKALAHAHPKFSESEVSALHQLLKEKQTDSAILKYFDREPSVAIAQPKARNLVDQKSYSYFYKDLNPDQQSALAKLQREIHFNQLSPEKQAEFLNLAGQTHWKGAAAVSKDGLTPARYAEVTALSNSKILELAKKGEVTLKPNREKAQALQNFKKYLEKEFNLKNSYASVDALANQKTMVLGELETGDARIAEKISAQTELKAPDFKGKSIDAHYTSELSGIKASSPEGKVKYAEVRREVENQLEYWNAQVGRINGGSFKFANSKEQTAALKDALKNRKELESVYDYSGGGKYTPEKVMASSPITHAPVSQVLAPEAAKYAEKFEVDTFTHESAQLHEEFKTVQTRMDRGNYSMTQAKDELEKLKVQKQNLLHFDPASGGRSDAESIHAQFVRNNEETQRQIDKALQDVEQRVKTTRSKLQPIADYTDSDVGRGGIIDRRIESIQLNIKDPTERLEDLRTLKNQLAEDLKRISAISPEDQKILFPGMNFETMKLRIRAHMDQIHLP